ncbi:hypothetical protein AN958_10619, partial [Leucoagaricus sp. SymC.cos]
SMNTVRHSTLPSTTHQKNLTHALPFALAYLLNDHPPSWPISRGNVLMAFDNPKHYALETSQGELEWSSLIPSSSSLSPNGLVYLGKYRQPYTISMFHQLKCLDIVRAETVRDRERDSDVAGHEGQVGEGEGGEGREERKALARHCLNYLRQMVTCRADLELESFQYASHRSPIDLHGVYECKDWSRVYEEVEKNQREHEEWLMKRTTKRKTM